MVQACQRLPNQTDSYSELCVIDACRAELGRDDFESVHVELKYPNSNITLLTCAIFGQTAHRNHFLSAISEEFQQADGTRTLHDMFVAASDKMMQHSVAT